MSGERPVGARVVAEFITIVAGVLVALAAQSWFQRHSDRTQERSYIGRLMVAVQRDTTDISVTDSLMNAKFAAFRTLHDVIDGRKEVTDAWAFEDALVNSAIGGFTGNSLRDLATYRELEQTGKLALLGSPALREALIRYYQHAEGTRERILTRRSEFPRMVYGLERDGRAALYRSGAEALKRNGEPLTMEEIREIVRRLRTPEFRDQLNREQNYAAFMVDRAAAERAEALALLKELHAQPHRN